jgi:hypothetical protein
MIYFVKNKKTWIDYQVREKQKTKPGQKIIIYGQTT